MKFYYIYLPLLSINLIPLQANVELDEIKNNMYYEIIDVKKKYLSIKKKVFSPYKNQNFSDINYLDSLMFLSERLEENRHELFSSILDIDLSDDDIYFIDKLNNNSMILFYIINEFSRIYDRYSINMTNSTYSSFKEYSFDMKKMLCLERNMPYSNSQ